MVSADTPSGNADCDNSCNVITTPIMMVAMQTYFLSRSVFPSSSGSRSIKKRVSINFDMQLQTNSEAQWYLSRASTSTANNARYI